MSAGADLGQITSDKDQHGEALQVLNIVLCSRCCAKTNSQLWDDLDDAPHPILFVSENGRLVHIDGPELEIFFSRETKDVPSPFYMIAVSLLLSVVSVGSCAVLFVDWLGLFLIGPAVSWKLATSRANKAGLGNGNACLGNQL